MDMKNLVRLFDSLCLAHGPCTAVIHGEERFTYGELGRAVNALANRLRRMGIRRGDHVAVMLPNAPEFVFSYFALLKLGAVAVTLNTMSTPHELAHLLGNSDAVGLITTEALARKYREAAPAVPGCRHLLLTDAEAGQAGMPAALREEPPTVEAEDPEPDDPAVMIYTAGLTGKPLGAVLTHKNLLTQATLFQVITSANEQDRCLAVIPYFHSFGAATNLLGALGCGASMVLMDRFTLEGLFAAIARHRVTYLCAVPRLFLGMLFHAGADRYDTSSLRFCITGGSAMAPEFMPLFAEKFRVLFREGYGLTEASPVCAVSRFEKPQKPGSIGQAIPGMEARVVGENGQDLPVGETGELLIRGDNVMAGYYRNPEATARVIRDGWLHTSDLAFLDEEGCIFLKGRKKRMVITSGFNVYPQEIEEVLARHPAVARCRVEGKTDLMRGEIVKAVIVREPGAEADEREILRHCRTYLSAYKVPREVAFVPEIPS